MPEIFQLPLSQFAVDQAEVQVAPDDSILVAQNDLRSFSRDFRVLQWRFGAPNGFLGAGINPPRLTLGSDQVFIASTGIVYALDLATGALRWQRRINADQSRLLEPVAWLPASDTGGFPEMVCVVDDANLFSLRASDGALLWQQETFRGAGVSGRIVSTVPGPVQPAAPRGSAPRPPLPGGIVLVSQTVPSSSTAIPLEGYDPKNGRLAYLPAIVMSEIRTLPLVLAGWVFFAGLGRSGQRSAFGLPLANLPVTDFSPTSLVRLDIDFPDPRAGVLDPPFAAVLGLNGDPAVPSFCWTTSGGELRFLQAPGAQVQRVQVSRASPSLPIAYLNDEGEGRALLIGNQPGGTNDPRFGSTTLVALPIGSDPQLSFSPLSVFAEATPIRMNRRQFAATVVRPAGLGAFVFAFDLNSL